LRRRRERDSDWLVALIDDHLVTAVRENRRACRCAEYCNGK
jgi:hypothetical protein